MSELLFSSAKRAPIARRLILAVGRVKIAVYQVSKSVGSARGRIALELGYPEQSSSELTGTRPRTRLLILGGLSTKAHSCIRLFQQQRICDGSCLGAEGWLSTWSKRRVGFEGG